MRALDLNLASRPFKNNTLLWGVYGLAVLLLVVFTTWNVRTYRRHAGWLKDLRVQNSVWDLEQRDLEQRGRLAVSAVGRYDLKALFLQSNKANDVIRWKGFSWTRLFNRLEAVQPWEVRMISVIPLFHGQRGRSARLPTAETERSSVAVEGVAKDLRAFLELERALLLDPHFDRVEPERFDTTQNTGETAFQIHSARSIAEIEDQGIAREPRTAGPPHLAHLNAARIRGKYAREPHLELCANLF